MSPGLSSLSILSHTTLSSPSSLAACSLPFPDIRLVKTEHFPASFHYMSAASDIPFSAAVF